MRDYTPTPADYSLGCRAAASPAPGLAVRLWSIGCFLLVCGHCSLAEIRLKLLTRSSRNDDDGTRLSEESVQR